MNSILNRIPINKKLTLGEYKQLYQQMLEATPTIIINVILNHNKELDKLRGKIELMEAEELQKKDQRKKEEQPLETKWKEKGGEKK